MKYIVISLIGICMLSLGITAYFLINEKDMKVENEDAQLSDQVDTNDTDIDSSDIDQDEDIWITKEFRSHNFSLSYPETYSIHETTNGYSLISVDGEVLLINPEQRGLGFPFDEVVEMPIKVNGINLNKMRITQADTGNVSYLITIPYPESYNSQYLILFSYEEADSEVINIFDQVAASVEFK